MKRAPIRLPTRAIQNVLLAAAVATACAWFWPPEKNHIPALGPVYFLERMGYDALFALRGERIERLDPRIMVVGLDEESQEDLGGAYPVPRRYHAQVIRNLAKDGARLIVCDFLFETASTPTDDKELDAALKEAGNVILTSRIGRNFTLKLKALKEPHYNDELGIDFLADARVGLAEVSPDEDGIVRRYAPVLMFRDRWLPTLSAAAYLALADKTDEDIALTDSEIILGDLRIPRTGPTGVDPMDKAIIPSAYLDFPAGQGAISMPFRFSQVAYGKHAPGTYKDKIVFVGLVGTEQTREISDQYQTAYSRFVPESTGSIAGNTIPGVFVQAQQLNALLTNGFVTHLPEWSFWAIVFGVTLAGAWSVRHYFHWRGPAILLLGVCNYLLYAVMAFAHFNIHTPWLVPTTLILSTVGFLAYLERGTLRRRWAGYVAPEVLDTILRAKGDALAQRCVGTVVFGDIRGFTNFTQRHPPEKVVKLLNLHFERLTSIIHSQQGTIDKFMGDGVLTLFGVPLPRPDSAICAVRAAWRMCKASKEALTLDGEPFILESGFGVTTGPLVAGHVGSRMRHDFTVIGDVVNMAARLQGVTGAADVVIDEATLRLVEPHVRVESLGEVQIKGSDLPVACYRVVEWIEAPIASGQVSLPALKPNKGLRSHS